MKEIANPRLDSALADAIREAERFLKLARKAKVANEHPCKENSAAKRASMDLSRALVFVRDPWRAGR